MLSLSAASSRGPLEQLAAALAWKPSQLREAGGGCSPLRLGRLLPSQLQPRLLGPGDVCWCSGLLSVPLCFPAFTPIPTPSEWLPLTHPNVPPQSSQEGTLDAITPAENLPSLPRLLPPSGPFLKPDSCPSNASGDSSGHFSAARTAFPASSRPFPAGAAARVLLFSHILKRKSGILLSWGAQGRRAAPAGSQEATCGFHLAVFLKLF